MKLNRFLLAFVAPVYVCIFCSSCDNNYRTVTFDTDGGNAIASIKVKIGECVSAPEDPLKNDYCFDSWVDSNNNVFDFSTPITSNITVKARYLAATDGAGYVQNGNTYNINFVHNQTVEHIVVPGMHNDMKVVGTHYYYNCDNDSYIAAFMDCIKLKTIVLPSTFTTINNLAFYNCASLEEIKIGKNIQYIGELAFAGCSSLNSIKVDEKNNIFDSRNNCNAIIKTSTNQLVLGCKNTVIDETITSIGSDSFVFNASLTSINIHKNISLIANGAFRGCKNLTKFNVDVDNNNYSTDFDGKCLSDKNHTILYSYPSANGNIDNLPATVIRIGPYCFFNCLQLTSISFPTNLQYIDAYSFYNCETLNSIDLTNEIKEINEFAYYNCTSVTSLTIPSSVSKIYPCAFCGLSASTVSFEDSSSTWKIRGSSRQLSDEFTVTDTSRNAAKLLKTGRPAGECWSGGYSNCTWTKNV